MYLIHLKGDAGSIEVSHEKGREIKEMLADPAKQKVFLDVNDRMFQISAIKAVMPIQQTRAERNQAPVQVVLTKEQKDKRSDILRKMRRDLTKKGILGKEIVRAPATDVVWHENCVVCDEPNPPGMARVCSSSCYQKSPLAI